MTFTFLFSLFRFSNSLPLWSLLTQIPIVQHYFYWKKNLGMKEAQLFAAKFERRAAVLFMFPVLFSRDSNPDPRTLGQLDSVSVTFLIRSLKVWHLQHPAVGHCALSFTFITSYNGLSWLPLGI